MSRTKSELLFESYCDEHGMTLLRVPESEKKTPDYELTLGNSKIIIEVKELAKNERERLSDRLLEKRGYGSVITHVPGERVRKKISASSAQIKARTQGEFCGLLILYGSGRLSLELDSYQIRAAMCGLEHVVIAVPSDFSASPYAVGSKFGAKRQMTADSNTSISAIGVISDNQPGRTELVIYHNKHAAIPIDPRLFYPYKVRQYRLRDDSENQLPPWEQVRFDP